MYTNHAALAQMQREMLEDLNFVDRDEVESLADSFDDSFYDEDDDEDEDEKAGGGRGGGK